MSNAPPQGLEDLFLGRDTARPETDIRLEWEQVGIGRNRQIESSTIRGLPVKHPEDAALALWRVPRDRRWLLLSSALVSLIFLGLSGYGVKLGGQIGLLVAAAGLLGALMKVLQSMWHLRNLDKAERANRAIVERMGVEFYRRVRESRLEDWPPSAYPRS